MPGPVCVDVVVVGAGISGLAAAHELQQLTNGRADVVVLEAKDRVGGRLCGKSLPTANGTDEWDLGGQWVSSSQIYVLQLLEEFGLGTFPQFSEGEKKMWMYDKSDVRTYKGLYPSLGIFELLDLDQLVKKIDKMVAQIPLSSPASAKHAAEWDGMTLETFIRQSTRCQATFDVMSCGMRTVFGTELSQLSLFYFLYYCALSGGINRLVDHGAGDAQELRVQKTAYQLVVKLREKIGAQRVKCGQPVTKIDQSDSTACTLTTADGTTYRARYVVMAIPPHLVNRVDFHPELPIDRRRLGDRMPVGHLIKFIATYRTAFWKERGQSGEGMFLTRQFTVGPVCYLIDATSFRGSPALVGFIGAEHATYWTHKSMAERQSAVVAKLSEILGSNAKDDLIHYEDKDWAKEPYNGGCPVSVMQPGCLVYFHHALRTPFRRVHWAGTETALKWTGYIDGGVEAGQRAAGEVAQKLNSSRSDGVVEPTEPTPVSPAFQLPGSHRGGSSKSARLAKGLCLLVALCGAGYATYRYVNRPQLE